MTVTADKPAPYAPTSAVLGILERHRTKGLPSPVDADVLARAGISMSLIPRTLQALHVLDLLTDEGTPSKTLEGMRLAPEAEYKQRLTEWLNAAYADALQFVDPATADEVNVLDAFRGYKPIGQQSRMVTLFLGLYTAAGVTPERQRQPARKPAGGSPAKPKSAQVATSSRLHDATRNNVQPTIQHGLPPAIGGLLASLPKDGEGWTQSRRDKFMATFGAVIDFCFLTQSAEAATNTGTDQ